MAEIKADEFVDITDVNCPVTFVKAKVAIEEIDEGHKVLKLEDNGDGTFELYVEKGEE